MTKTTIERISEAALDLLERQGPEAVTMRAVAKRARVTAMAIYHHFPNRTALLHAVTDGEFERVVKYFDARRRKLPAGAGPAALLLALMHGQIDYAVRHPRLFDYCFSEARPDARRFPQDFAAGKSPTMNPVAAGIEAAMKAGWLREDDPWEVAMQLSALTNGYLVMYRTGRFSYSEDEFRAFCERAMGRMINGLRGRTARVEGISRKGAAA